ncbi:hypothetical protein EV421DRAFT_1911324 [Armillaria borealis]|uniref:Uncharacterized protein n=1 Tax=Armillaria borealis TaxID=47425 RepID=A0AA39MFW6_9AGAR|nr:hypothetical protein EV421DRAFT_1911324 [Armillaria borealis]
MFGDCGGPRRVARRRHPVCEDSRFVRREENNRLAMNDSKESVFVGNVIGAISAQRHSVVPISASSFSASLAGLRFTFTYTPTHKILRPEELEA